MYSFNARRSYTKAMSHGSLAEMTLNTPTITSIGGVACVELKRTLKAVRLQANGVAAWFPMYGLSEVPDMSGVVAVSNGFRSNLNREQREMLGDR